jgi:hypothetical protein
VKTTIVNKIFKNYFKFVISNKMAPVMEPINEEDEASPSMGQCKTPIIYSTKAVSTLDPEGFNELDNTTANQLKVASRVDTTVKGAHSFKKWFERYNNANEEDTKKVENILLGKPICYP